MSSSTGTGGQRATYPYVISSEKNTTFNRTTASAQGTPDLYRFPLAEVEDSPPSGKVEKKYSFENKLDKAFENDSEFDVKRDKNGGEEKDGGKDSGRSSPVELSKGKNGDEDVIDDSIGYV
jgi:hypothetical protein